MNRELDNLFRITADLVCVADKSGLCVQANDAFLSALGYAESEVVRHSIWEWIHPDDIAPTQAVLLDSAASGGQVSNFTNRYRTRAGEWLHLSWNAAQDPETGLFWGVARDITEQLKVQQALSASEQGLSATLSAIAEGVLVVDAQARVTRLNPVATQMTGLAQEDALGQAVDDVLILQSVSGNVDERVFPCRVVLEEFRSVNEPVSEVFLKHRSGTEIPVTYSAAPIHADASGELMGAVIVFRDVSAELNKRRVALSNANEALARKDVVNRIKDRIHDGLAGFFTYLTEECSRVLGVEHVSVWLFDDSAEGIRCQDRYIRSEEKHECGLLLDRKTYPAYFEQISQFTPLVASDALQHPALCDLVEPYLKPASIQSLLDIPLQIGERLSGVICCEAVGVRNRWKAEDVDFLSSVANAVLLALEFNERTLTEKKLIESEAYNRAIIESSEDCLEIISMDGRFLHMPDKTLKALEIDDFERIRNTNWLDAWMGEDRTEAEAAMAQASSGESARFQGYCPTARGKPRWWDVIMTPLVSASGSVDRLMVVSRDITVARGVKAQLEDFNTLLEERIQERTNELAVSEERQRLMVEQVQDYAIFMLDPTGHVASWNTGAARAKGYTAEEIIGRHYSCFYLKEDYDNGLPEALLETAKKEGKVSHEGWRVRKDGSRFWASVSITAIHNTDGSLTGFAKVTRDLTERRLAELALKDALQEQTALAEAAKKGERAKSEFLAVMSHEVRTPMNAIIGFTDLMLDSDNLVGEDLENARTIHKSAHALLRILDDILDYTSVEDGKYQIEEEAFDLKELIREVVKTANTSDTSNDVSIQVILESTIPDQLSGDVGRLRQILLNLLRNAVKFTGEGDVVFKVESVREESSSDQTIWRFIVQDTGPGIDQKDLGRIFDPFTQVDSSASRKYGGTGLGLAISSRLAKLMGGVIRCQSELDVGSEFTLEIPLGPVRKQDAVRKPNVKKSEFNQDFSKAYPLDVLIVEDNQVNQAVIAALLKKAGYKPMLAKNGAEAVEAYKKYRPTCVFMDIQMPVMDGIDATEAIRTWELKKGLSQTYITALTANTNPADKQRCIDVGMTGYLNKPVKRDSILNSLKAASEFVSLH